jgi:hypothetical protein
MENTLRSDVWWIEDPARTSPTQIPRTAVRRAPPLFAGATSKRGHESLVGAALAAVIGALWVTGAWMIVDIARALDAAQRAEPSQVRVDR